MAGETNKEQPIIIVKKIIKHGGHHGGAWKVALADFMTAMFALFLVLWLVNQSKDIKQEVQSYFQDPVGYTKAYKMGLFKGGSGILRNDALNPQQTESQISLEEQLKEELEKLAGQIMGAIDAMPGLEILRNHIQVEATREGLRVQLIEGSEDVTFFKPGSATLSIKGELILKTIASELQKLTNHLVIEGHTDASDFGRGEDYSNWELSADRANAARRAMETKLKSGQIFQVRGYASNKLRFKDNPMDPRNRRITILVLNRKVGEEDLEDNYISPIIMSRE